MAKIDTSLVADLPLFAGLATADLDAILSEAKSIPQVGKAKQVMAGLFDKLAALKTAEK